MYYYIEYNIHGEMIKFSALVGSLCFLCHQIGLASSNSISLALT